MFHEIALAFISSSLFSVVFVTALVITCLFASFSCFLAPKLASKWRPHLKVSLNSASLMLAKTNSCQNFSPSLIKAKLNEKARKTENEEKDQACCLVGGPKISLYYPTYLSLSSLLLSLLHYHRTHD